MQFRILVYVILHVRQNKHNCFSSHTCSFFTFLLSNIFIHTLHNVTHTPVMQLFVTSQKKNAYETIVIGVEKKKLYLPHRFFYQNIFGWRKCQRSICYATIIFMNYRQGDNDLDGCILHSPYLLYRYLLYGLNIYIYIYNIHVSVYESSELPCE